MSFEFRLAEAVVLQAVKDFMDDGPLPKDYRMMDELRARIDGGEFLLQRTDRIQRFWMTLAGRRFRREQITTDMWDRLHRLRQQEAALHVARFRANADKASTSAKLAVARGRAAEAGRWAAKAAHWTHLALDAERALCDDTVEA